MTGSMKLEIFRGSAFPRFRRIGLTKIDRYDKMRNRSLQ